MTQTKQRTPSLAAIKPLHASLHGGLQIFELKQLADMEAAYKRQCREALGVYRLWEKRHRQETDVIALLYGNMEGMMLRRRAEDAVTMYWTVRQDFRRGFHDYLAKNCCYPSRASTQKSA